ncbi:Alpha/Beta hydrolase protein [Ilyonectria destructans]|nr:Alpha/Beta hydrolase protein [Ilyonectria destructans]
MANIKPFKIAIPDAALAKLKQKLELTRFPEGEIEEAGWEYGVPLKDIKDLTKYWIDKYDWRAAERKLNEIPQFRTEISVEGFDPVDLHFVHQKSDVEGAVPLLFLHGWPGSFIEVTKLLPLLKGGNGKPAFHVVAPSLPNYGFSARVAKKGFGLGQYAEAANNLMLALGYDQYVTQGGDWGCLITRTMGARFPQHVKASHINMVLASEPKWTEENPKPEYTARELVNMKEGEEWGKSGNGYIAIQSTKPATLAFSLADSPTGLLAWIYEKLVDRTDNYPWTFDEILTWISIYYFSTAGPSASIYIYYEFTHDAMYHFGSVQAYIDLPLGIADFPKEVTNAPRSWRKGLGNVVSDVSFDKGGHFAAWERPADLAGALAEMFGRGGGAEEVYRKLGRKP